VIYASWIGEIPSISTDIYTGPVALDPGVTTALAVTVNADGLVSGWAEAEYTLRNIVDPVIFTDPAVERAIRQAIGKPGGALVTSDIWHITELTVEDAADYTTLDDLVFCPRLEVLRLRGRGMRCDISVLAGLPYLSDLSLTAFAIDAFDLEIIGQCAGLESLDLSENRIGSVKALEGLEHLIHLDLSVNNILDVTSLSRLGSLRSLRLTQNVVQDIKALSALENLRILEASENRLSSLSGIESMAHLETINVSNNPGLTTIREISSLSRLVSVKAAHCSLETLPDMSALTVLESLYVHNNSITNLVGLTGSPTIREISAANNVITSLEPLRRCDALEILDISHNAVVSAEALGGNPSLTLLRIEHNQVTSLLPLITCPKLRDVYAFGNNLTDPLTAFNGTPLEGRIRR
jgi:hypothetical protein